MKDRKEFLDCGATCVEYCRIPHVICSADFDTSRPVPNRINRIANEINEYLRWKRKSGGVSK